MKTLLVLVAILGGACGGGGGGDDDDDGQPTGAVCPTTSPPTYASFGSAFFASYCTRCHSSTVTDRQGAPPNLNWDTEAEIDAQLDDIDRQAAAGPDATNTLMPFTTPPGPTLAERTTLGQFLACEKAH